MRRWMSVGWVLWGCACGVLADQEGPLWLRYPSISPDGQHIVFSYQGDLWKVAASGGEARLLTRHPGHDTQPIWSRNGQYIAFASDRYGQFDVFLMSSHGGDVRRLTFHSADDFPTSFTPQGDVLFTSSRLDAASCVQFPSPAQPELYSVGVSADLPSRVLTTPAMYAVHDPDGKTIAYSDQKGMEDEWRKHDDSSFARDLWLVDVASGKHRRLTSLGVDDRQPVWAPDGHRLYFLSERSGSFNVWLLDPERPDEAVQVTDHEIHPVRFLSVSGGGDLCYSFDGELWTKKQGEEASQKIDVEIPADWTRNREQLLDVSDEITEFDISPDGKEIAFIARGEVFVTSVDYPNTQALTHTAEQERSLSFSPDGKTLIYASERNGSWNLYTLHRKDPKEPRFFNASAFEEKPLLVTENECFQPLYSPDGKRVAYLENRTTVRVLDVATGEIVTVLPGTVNYSYVDGDQWFTWSPDGQWLMITYLSPGRYSDEVGLVSSDGKGEIINLTRSGYEDRAPRWTRKGEMIYWASDRHGLRRHASWSSESDIYVACLTSDAWERFNLSEAEYELLKEKEKKEEKEKASQDEEESKASKKGKKSKKEEGEDEEQPKLADPVDLELDQLEHRRERLTLHSADLAGALMTSDGETLYYLAEYEKGFDLWKYQHRKKEIKRLAKIKARRIRHMLLGPEEKNLYVLTESGIQKVDLEKEQMEGVPLSAEMTYWPDREQAYLFEHVWRQMFEKFYDASMHGVDWPYFKKAYARFLPFVNNRRDFAEMLSEMLGELNASHTGAGFRPKSKEGDDTAALGIFPDERYSGEGVRILEIMEQSPLLIPETRVKPGILITAIDGHPIAAGANYYALLNHKEGKPTRLTYENPEAEATWTEVVKPISMRQERQLAYSRWEKSRRERVEQLSGGRLGYAHVRSMSDGSYRDVFDEVFGRHATKEALILDTRFNGGGNLDEPLIAFLTGEKFAYNKSRGVNYGPDPLLRWTKPSIVVVNEGNYSDAHCFPAIYSALKVGHTVGMPVPGTCTAVWWETLQDQSLYFGIPQLAWTDLEGDPLENQHHIPDHVVDNDPELEASGRDQQLEKAVEVLLNQLEGISDP